MARDYTKYNVQGLGENLNKRKLVFSIVKDWIEKNNPTFEELQKAFPDEVQGGKGFIRKEKEVSDPQRFNMREPLKIKNGAHIVVSNQWGENIPRFLELASSFGYLIIEAEKTRIESKLSQRDDIELTALTFAIRSTEIKADIDILVKQPEDRQIKFTQKIVDFVDANREYYWIIPLILNFTNVWNNINDEEGLDLSFDDLSSVSCNDIPFNPYEKFRLFFNCHEEMFATSKDDDEPREFFKTVMDAFYEFSSYDELLELTEEEMSKFINLSKTVLFCTISEECKQGIDIEDLTNLLTQLNFESLPDINHEIMGDDISFEIISDVLLALTIEIEEHRNDEHLWRGMYAHNFENIAQEILKSDVFDIDFARNH